MPKGVRERFPRPRAPLPNTVCVFSHFRIPKRANCASLLLSEKSRCCFVFQHLTQVVIVCNREEHPITPASRAAIAKEVRSGVYPSSLGLRYAKQRTWVTLESARDKAVPCLNSSLTSPRAKGRAACARSSFLRSNPRGQAASRTGQTGLIFGRITLGSATSLCWSFL